jgi:hypothetical protein
VDESSDGGVSSEGSCCESGLGVAGTGSSSTKLDLAPSDIATEASSRVLELASVAFASWLGSSRLPPLETSILLRRLDLVVRDGKGSSGLDSQGSWRC